MVEFAVLYLAQTAKAAFLFADDAVLHAQPAAMASLGVRRSLRQVKRAASGGVGDFSNLQYLLRLVTNAVQAHAELGGDEA